MRSVFFYYHILDRNLILFSWFYIVVVFFIPSHRFALKVARPQTVARIRHSSLYLKNEAEVMTLTNQNVAVKIEKKTWFEKYFAKSLT